MAITLDKMVLVDAQDAPVAYFLSNKELYGTHSDIHGVREFNSQSDGVFMPTPVSVIAFSGEAIRVTVSGKVNGKRYSSRMLVAKRLLGTALGSNGLVGKQIRIGARNVTIDSVRIPSRAVTVY